jgi:hypothetical protein
MQEYSWYLYTYMDTLAVEEIRHLKLTAISSTKTIVVEFADDLGRWTSTDVQLGKSPEIDITPPSYCYTCDKPAVCWAQDRICKNCPDTKQIPKPSRKKCHKTTLDAMNPAPRQQAMHACNAVVKVKPKQKV